MDKIYVILFSNAIQISTAVDTGETIEGWVYWLTEKKDPSWFGIVREILHNNHSPKILASSSKSVFQDLAKAIEENNLDIENKEYSTIENNC